MGTPFIAPRQDFVPASVLNYGQYFANNRVTMWYVGLQASYRKAVFMLRTSYSKNYGTFREPPTSYPTQFSGLLSAQIPVSRWNNTFIMVKMALDTGGLYTNSTGGILA